MPVCQSTVWDPRVCPECGETSRREGKCVYCGNAWNHQVCPACKKSHFRTWTLDELLYDKPDGMVCRDCCRRWEPESREEEETCPKCGSSEVEETFPRIPNFDEDPGVGLIVAVESYIPRTQDGTILHREMVAWLRFRGVRARVELLQWESWFISIQGFRARVTEEMMDPGKKPAEKEADG